MTFGMPVALLRHQVADLFLAPSPIVLEVGPRWVVLDHGGTIIDRVVPGTGLPCPFLEQGSEVRVQVPDLSPGDVRRKVVAGASRVVNVSSDGEAPYPHALEWEQPVANHR